MSEQEETFTLELPEPIALVDMDGTIADFTKAMGEGLKVLEGPGESWDYDNYSQDDEPLYMKARRRLVKSQPGFWANLPPIPRGFEILSLLKMHDFSINIFTKAPRKSLTAFTEKAQWCEKHLSADFPDIKISMVQGKGLHYRKILVDDWPPYIERWLKFRPRGQVIMPVCKYNRHFEHPQVARFYGDRPGELDGFSRMLEQLRKQCLR